MGIDTGFWTDDRILELRLRFEAGESYQKIADAMGCTKNAALAKAKRLGFDDRRSSPEVLKPKRHPIEFPPVSRCQWPIGDPGEEGFRFCGDAAKTERPYCAKHCAIAYVRPPDPASKKAA